MGSFRHTPLLLLAAVAVALAGCGSGGVDESAYVRANRQVLRSVPRMPGSRLLGSFTMGERNGLEESPAHGGSFVAYVTHESFSTPPGWGAGRVLGFYVRRLRGAGWTLVMSSSDGRTFLKEPATLFVSATAQGVLISVNHDRHADGTR